MYLNKAKSQQASTRRPAGRPSMGGWEGRASRMYMCSPGHMATVTGGSVVLVRTSAGGPPNCRNRGPPTRIRGHRTPHSLQVCVPRSSSNHPPHLALAIHPWLALFVHESERPCPALHALSSPPFQIGGAPLARFWRSVGHGSQGADAAAEIEGGFRF